MYWLGGALVCAIVSNEKIDEGIDGNEQAAISERRYVCVPGSIEENDFLSFVFLAELHGLGRPRMIGVPDSEKKTDFLSIGVEARLHCHGCPRGVCASGSNAKSYFLLLVCPVDLHMLLSGCIVCNGWGKLWSVRL
jgi:hypothetical protein